MTGTRPSAFRETIEGDESPVSAPSTDVEMGVLRESQDRALEREGIPMYLALVREGDAPPFPAAAAADRAFGADLAARLDDQRARVAATQRDGDMGVLITLLAATAYGDFDRSALR